MIRIGIIGMGQISRAQHVPTLLASPDFTLAATVDPTTPAGDYGVAHFASARELFDSEVALDAVAICTPPAFRYDVARAAIDAGLHVLVEKPPAMTPTHARDLAERASERGISFFAAWHSRFAPALPTATALIARHGLRAMKITWLEDNEKWHPHSAWLWEANGFGVFDPGINAISMMQAMVPGTIGLRSARLEIRAGQQAPVRAEIELQALDVNIPISCFFDCDYKGETEKWCIECTLGDGSLMTLDGGGATLTHDAAMLVARPVGEGGVADHEYRDLYEHFATLIQNARSDALVSPLQLVSEILAFGERHLIQLNEGRVK